MRGLVSKFIQRSTLMITSFVLAVSSLSAAMPLFLSQNAFAQSTTDNPTVTLPISTGAKVHTPTYTITGTVSDSSGIEVTVYKDMDNDGQIDSPEDSSVTTVTAGNDQVFSATVDLGVGDNNFIVTAKKSNKDASGPVNVPTITYDATAPSAPTADPVSGNYTTAQEVTLEASDNVGGSGLDGIYYTTDGTSPTNLSTLYVDGTPISVTADQTIKAIAYDIAGNFSAVASFDYTINVPAPADITAPTVTVLSPSDGEVVGGLGNSYMTTVKLRINDATGVNLDSKYTWVAFENGVAVSGSVDSSSSKYALQHLATDDSDVYTAVVDTTDFVAALHNSGTYLLAVRAQDTLGNGSSHKFYTGAAHHGTKLTVDNNRTHTSLTSPANNTYQAQDFTVAGTASDTETSINHVSIYISHSPWSAGGYVVNNQLATYDPNTQTFSYDASGIPDGTYTVKAFAYDQNGNVQSDSSTIVVDTDAPVAPTGLVIFKGHNSILANKLPADGYTNDTNIRIYWDPSTESDLAGYWFGTKTNTHHAWVPVGTNYYDGNMTPGNNPYHYSVIAVDEAGNESPIVTSYNIYLDQTNPTISASISDSIINFTDLNPVVTVNATDLGSDIDYIQYKVMDSTLANVLGWITMTSNTDTVDLSSLGDGDYVLRARAFDNAGNKKSGADVAFTIDRTAPSATITTNGTQATATPTINGLVDADADTLELTIDGIAQVLSWVAGDTTWSFTPTTALSDGSHTIQIIAKDVAGNTGGQNGNITISVPVTLLAATPGAPAPTPQATVTPGEVLGDQTTTPSDTNTDANSVKTADKAGSVLGSSTDNSMNIFGLAWYWWLAILAAIIAIWWFIAAALRRRDQQAQ